MQQATELSSRLPGPILPGQPLTALAPMQDVTTLPFMTVVGGYGPPDYFFTEYFRVHQTSRLEPHILESITGNDTGRPVFAQFIGESLPDIERTVKALLDHPVAGIDINLGCPAPKVYKKNVGGGLLRDIPKIRQIFELLRSINPGLFTVKCRIGFDGTENYAALLDLVNEFSADLLSVHGRTVKELYRSEVHYEFIKQAVETVDCPVLANGNVSSARAAREILDYTGAAGVMIGRAAIRNPWLFRQCREAFAGGPVFAPTLGDVRGYVDRLWEATYNGEVPERQHTNYMKKFLNFVGQSMDPEGRFLHEMRRTKSKAELMEVCDRHMAADGKAEQPFADEPYAGVIARPNRESAQGCSL